MGDSIGRLSDGAGGVVVLEAAAGLGKTALLDHAMARAAGSGSLVRHAAPAPPEQHFPFGVVRSLLESPLADASPEHRARLLGGPAAPAAGLLLDGVVPADDATIAVAHSVLWLCSALAERQPLMLVVDDAQWCDPASLEVLSYVARRIDDLPLLIVVAARPGDAGAAADLLSLLGGVRAATVLRPQPLTRFGAVRLIRALAPGTPYADCLDCHRAAAGNPWLLSELAAQTAAHGTAAVAGAPAVSASGRTVVRRRVAALSPPDRAVAVALSVLGDGADGWTLSAVAGVSVGDITAARDALTNAGLLAHADGMRFAHGLIPLAIRDDLSGSEREGLHAAAARALMSSHADDAAVAGHLLSSAPGGDPAASAVLVRVAAEAAERGEPRVAVDYLDRALDERAPGDDRARILARLATLVFDIGCPDARARLREALKEVGDDEGRVDVLTRMAMLSVVDGHDAELSRMLDDELPGDADRDLRLAYEAAVLDALIMVPERHAERADRAAAIDLRPDDDPLLARVVLAHRAWLAAELGAPGADRTAALAEQALDGDALLDASAVRSAYHIAVRSLTLSDRTDQAALAIARLRDRATARGSRRLQGAAAWFSAELALRTGQVAQAEADARTAIDFVDDGPNVVSGGAAEVLVQALAERGAFDEAHELLRETGPDDAAARVGWDVGLLHSRALLALAEGDFERAYADACEAGRLRTDEGRRNPSRTAWRSTAALALAHLGRRDLAAGLADEELALAERYGAPMPIATALHARAVAEADPEARVAFCERALALTARAPMALVAARVRLVLGTTLRSMGRLLEAREALRPALPDAHAAGAKLLAEEVRRELVATGLRPRRAATSGADALTPRQRQVCKLAARGKGNREIAQQLFLSIKTVETHLALCYRKLGVARRDELAGALAT